MNTDKHNFPIRLKQVSSLFKSVKDFSNKTEIPYKTINNYLTGINEPKMAGLLAISKVSGVALEWLMTGQGSMMLEGIGLSSGDIIKIPHYDAQLAAGAGSFNHDAKIISHIPMDRPLLERLAGKGNVKDLVFLDVRGDSMLPTIANDDMALINLKNKTIREDIMAFVFEGECYIKRIRKMFGGIDIISDNKELYPPYNICKERIDQFHVIGKVLSIYHVL